MNVHVSIPELERVAGGGPTPRHAEDCPRCAAEVARVAAAGERYLAAHPPDVFARAVLARARPRQRQRAVRRWSLAAGGLACAAAALLFFARRDPEAPAPTVRAKGGDVALVAFARRGGATFAIADGEALSPGDRLAFAYSAPGPRHVLLLGIDDAGTISRYHPAEGAAAPVAGGRGQLPVGLHLDARPGEERLVAVFGVRAPDEAGIRRALAASLDDARRRGGGIGDMVLALSEEHATIWFQKR